MSLQNYNTQNDAGSNLFNFTVIRDHSELFRAECLRLMEESNKACKRMQDDDQKCHDQRLKDIHFLKKELEQKLEDIILETDRLITLQGRVHKAVESCKEPLKVVIQCIDERKGRVPQERHHDAVDQELLTEREAIEAVAGLLQRMVQQLTEQIRLNRSAKYLLEKDLKEKFEAQSIDNVSILMTPHSNSNIAKSHNKSVLPSSSSPMQWEKISEINLAKAEKQRTNSMSLRALVESLLEQTASDLEKQFHTTTSAFHNNVLELKKAKGQMEDHLSKILLEHNKQQMICVELEVSLKDNEHCLGLAQARLNLRFQRPSKEQCLDLVQSKLLNEVQKIKAYIAKLHAAVAQSQDEQRALFRCQLELQENINNKTKSLYIDEVLCAQHREPVVIHKF